MLNRSMTQQTSNPPLRKRRVLVTDEMRQAIVALCGPEGPCYAEVAARHDVSVATVCNIARAAGLTARKWERKLTREDVMEARRRYRAGETLAVLGGAFAVCQSTMHRAVTGVTYRDVCPPEGGRG